MLRLILLLLIISPALCAKTYKVYYLGGQSNMEGFGNNSELPKDYLRPLKDVRIFTGNPAADFKPDGGLGVWDTLQPGFGLNFGSDGSANVRSEHFGPELSFGHRIAAINKNQSVAIIKYALGGSALGYGVGNNWFPDYRRGNGINQYDHFLTTLRHAFSEQDIDGDGEADKLIPAGIIWMQGESDAYHSDITAHRYMSNLQHIMALFRAALRDASLPVVMGKITDSKMDPEDGLRMNWGSVVQQAQLDFVEQDTCAALVTVTESFTHLEDGWHYHSADYLQLGEQFANSVNLLERQCATD
ncbi:sialate O-acetylesterase [Alteromonas gilva]|uniref:Sialate O-acetylesterase n=1 Tax=Alteromonas gilva TaxID=2987522 RepID=A0ABT5KYH8_9ALTE|nr:sialate O-acetylesterase [Alteromonas gilva]MDC8829697.1 sialate O-acetylesterase [Alteromonas gilva]